jgi:hypothetical protein
MTPNVEQDFFNGTAVTQAPTRKSHVRSAMTMLAIRVDYNHLVCFPSLLAVIAFQVKPTHCQWHRRFYSSLAEQGTS